jgi:hypothetical protein
MKKIIYQLLLLGLFIGSMVLTSCTPQRGVRGTYEVKNGKHVKLTKGKTPSCLNAW